jgi:hypothetical protein
MLKQAVHIVTAGIKLSFGGRASTDLILTATIYAFFCQEVIFHSLHAIWTFNLLVYHTEYSGILTLH